MASRHRLHHRVSSPVTIIVAALSMAVAFAAIVAALAVNVVDGDRSAPRDVATAPPTQPIAQEGVVVALTPTSMTARSADGSDRTYVINADTNAITEMGSQIGTVDSFAVHDQVAIVGVVQDGTAVATAVANRELSNLNGPPMDGPVTP